MSAWPARRLTILKVRARSDRSAEGVAQGVRGAAIFGHAGCGQVAGDVADGCGAEARAPGVRGARMGERNEHRRGGRLLGGPGGGGAAPVLQRAYDAGGQWNGA